MPELSAFRNGAGTRWKHPDFNHRLVDNLQMTLWLGAFARGHLPLVEELQRLRQNLEIRSPQDLAKFDQSQWLAMIAKPVNGTRIGFPPDVPGNNDEEKAATYRHDARGARKFWTQWLQFIELLKSGEDITDTFNEVVM